MLATTSSVYEGTVRHRRFAPVPHEFSYDVAMLYLDLDHVRRDLDHPPLASAGGWTPLSFRDGDYLPRRSRDLAAEVRAMVARESGVRPEGPVRLLTYVRTFGHVFNPVSFYYCFDADDTHVVAIVAEITNTPWKERHCYVLPSPAGSRLGAGLGERRGVWHEFDKQFHVSPFLPMQQHYRWFFTPPGEELLVHMENSDPGDSRFAGEDRDPRRGNLRFDATLQLRRRPLTRAALTRVLARYPLMTVQVVAHIHWQAFKLWRKRAPFFSHPSKRREELTPAGPAGPRSPST